MRLVHCAQLYLVRLQLKAGATLRATTAAADESACMEADQGGNMSLESQGRMHERQV
jgi:hypothetical protein